MHTDCQSLLTIAEQGAQKAGEADKPLARAWRFIAGTLDGDISSLVRDGRLVWMPAHLSMASIGVTSKSNRKELTALDWRANRLVDALAKQAAAQRQAPESLTRLLKSAKVAVKHAAALLGEVTHAANNHKVVVNRPDGRVVTQVLRDATPKPPQSAAASGKAGSLTAEARLETCEPLGEAKPGPEAQDQCVRGDAAASRPSWFQPRKRTVAAVLVAKRRRLDDVAATRRCVEEMALAARPDAPSGPSDRLSAAERMAQLRERVLARIETQPMAVPR